MDSLWLEVRPISTDIEALRERVTPQEWDEASAMSSKKRRAEWLTWRALVRERLGQDVAISYDANGAPVADIGQISVSHTLGWVAVVWSRGRCAVDIELLSRKISHTTAQRFISDTEKTLADSADPRFAISVWCAKEAAYKYSHIEGLDFLRDLRITSSDIAVGRMCVSICESPPLSIELITTDRLILAIIVT
jgi:phosphopantetheinyl transferase